MNAASSIQAVMHNLFEFQKSGYLCDTVIIADDGQLKAHSSVLAAASPVFKSALKCDGVVKEHTLVLPGVKLYVAKAIIQIIYTGKATLQCSEYESVDTILKMYEELCISQVLDQSHRYWKFFFL